MNTITSYNNGRRAGTLLGWDPLRLFSDLMTWEPAGSQTVWTAFRAPVTVRNTDDGATITLDMPGVDPKDVELTFEAGTLAISGKRGEHTYQYSVALGDMIDPDAIEAHLDKGVLTVQAHKRPEAKPRKIAVKASPQKILDSGE